MADTPWTPSTLNPGRRGPPSSSPHLGRPKLPQQRGGDGLQLHGAVPAVVLRPQRAGGAARSRAASVLGASSAGGRPWGGGERGRGERSAKWWWCVSRGGGRRTPRRGGRIARKRPKRDAGAANSDDACRPATGKRLPHPTNSSTGHTQQQHSRLMLRSIAHGRRQESPNRRPRAVRARSMVPHSPASRNLVLPPPHARAAPPAGGQTGHRLVVVCVRLPVRDGGTAGGRPAVLLVLVAQGAVLLAKRLQRGDAHAVSTAGRRQRGCCLSKATSSAGHHHFTPKERVAWWVGRGARARRESGSAPGRRGLGGRRGRAALAGLGAAGVIGGCSSVAPLTIEFQQVPGATGRGDMCVRAYEFSCVRRVNL